MSAEQQAHCPLEAVDRRLDDAHRQWHQAEAAYFEPEGFRRAIQAVIQTLRTVTFLLQNRKHDIPDFETWYRGWQDKMRDDPLLRWMVDARNRIEKQGDLEVNSFVRAEILASYLDEGPKVEVPSNLFDGVQELLKSLPDNDVGRHLVDHGTLQIERRWVENSLPDFELLDAAATAYGRLSQLLADAHRQMGLAHPTTMNVETGQPFEGDREGRLPCMIAHDAVRTLNIRLSDGLPFGLQEKSHKLTRSEAEAVAARFPVRPEEVFGKAGSTTREMFQSLFETACKVFLKDGYHETIAFLFREAKLRYMFGMRPEEQGQKYLMMRALADEVRRHDADAVVVLGEVWSAPYDPAKPYRRAVSSPHRKEYLTASLVEKGGQATQLAREIQRAEDGISLGDKVELNDAALFTFAPVLEAWGSDLPKKWADAMTEAAARGDVGRPD